MPEALTTSLVSELMPRLYAAFPRTIKGDNRLMLDTYRNGLRGLSGDAFRAAIDVAIQQDQYFPKVARLRELAMAWQRHNRPTIDIPQREAAWDVCPVCGARARSQTITRRKRDPEKNYALVLDQHGQEIWEEVESKALYMDHDSAKHHVTRNEEAFV